MLTIYPSNETSFSDNGLKTLTPLKALIYKEDNGDYYLEIKDTLENLEYYISGNIIRASTPWGYQCFRIKDTQIENRKISFIARHLYFDSENYIIEDSYVFEMNCNAALDHLNSATDITSPFTTISDIPSEFSYRCVRKSLAEAVNDVIDRWGGHLVRNNYNIEVRQNIGLDRGVNLEYGKNIVNIKSVEDWSNVTTKLMPVGKDGLKLPEVWLAIDTELYDIPYTKVITFSQDNINSEDFTDNEGNLDETSYNIALENDLRTKGLNYLNSNSAPKVNYTLNAYLTGINDIGDTIWVHHPKCKIDLITNVISLVYDCLSDKITKLEFGNFKNNLKNLLTTIENKIVEKGDIINQEVTSKLEKELEEATNQIKGVLGGSYVINEGDKILIVDQLPKENAQNVIMINNGGIGFSTTGINGTFNSAWTISGELDMQNINVINLVGDMIKGGTIKLGSNENESGSLQLFDEYNTLILELNKDGILIYCKDGSIIKLNADVGFTGYDSSMNPVYWVNYDEFHMQKCIIEGELTLQNRLRFLSIDNSTNTGVGIVKLV